MADWFSLAKRALLNRSQALAGAKCGDRGHPHRRVFAFETLEPRLTLAAAGLVTTPQTYSGALSGKFVFTSGGHGWGWNGSAYVTERPDYWESNSDTSDGDIVEDFGNQDQMSLYADYLLRAGATVVPMRPVGRQTNEVVLDNDSAGVTFSGTWSNSSNSRFYDEDYGATTDAIPYKFSTADPNNQTATATYTPNIPAAGFYPVYTWVHWGTDRTLQTYTVNHTSGPTQISVDHSKVGDGWVYLGTYHFNAGSSITEGSVQISNKAPNPTGDGITQVVIADAIRFGNGMGDFIESGAPTVSGKPREDENSYHWIARSIGQGATISDVIGSDSNVSAPSDFAEYMFHGSFGEALYVGFHSNGGSGAPTSAGRGARGLYDTSTSSQTPNQIALATLMGDQVNQDFQNLNGVFEYNWTTDTTNTDSHINFGEIDLGANAEMDATIVEVAFHDNLQDNALLRDPKVRDQIARSVYQGTLQYFSTYGTPAATNTSLPTTPTNVSARSDTSGAVTLSWSAGASTPTSVYGDASTGYKVYTSVDGYGFDGGRSVSGAGNITLTISGLATNTPYYFKVAAVNAGGESESSEVAAALPSGGTKQVLIVNGFDRFDRNQDIHYPYTQQGYHTPDPDGATNRVWPRYNNSFDYVIQAASAIQASRPGVHFASTSNEAVISGAVNLTDYDSVIWILGTESTANHTFDTTEQSKVTSFINAGGNLFVTGSEIAWDLDSQNHGRTFYRSTLGASYVADDAGTYNVTAAAAGIFAGMSSFSFSNGSAFSQLDGQLYDVAFPDVIAPQTGAVSALTYSGGTGGAAAIQKQGTAGKGSIVMFGFPFESMSDATTRSTAMGRILDFFGVAAENADFNGSTKVDAADYVLWRKFSGLTSGATRSQGDANGDGAVNNTDYSIWRGEFGTTPAAAPVIADSSGAALASIDTSIRSSNFSTSPSFALVRDAAIGELTARTSERRIARRAIAAATRSNTGVELESEWTSLLAYLAESKAAHDSKEFANDPKSDLRGDGQSPDDGQCLLGKELGQKMAP